MDEITQITLQRGEWIQVALAIGTIADPRYQIVQVALLEDGTPELRGDVPIRSWGSHDAELEPSPSEPTT